MRVDGTCVDVMARPFPYAPLIVVAVEPGELTRKRIALGCQASPEVDSGNYSSGGSLCLGQEGPTEVLIGLNTARFRSSQSDPPPWRRLCGFPWARRALGGGVWNSKDLKRQC